MCQEKVHNFIDEPSFVFKRRTWRRWRRLKEKRRILKIRFAKKSNRIGPLMEKKMLAADFIGMGMQGPEEPRPDENRYTRYTMLTG